MSAAASIGVAVFAFIAGYLTCRIVIMRTSGKWLSEVREAAQRARLEKKAINDKIEARVRELSRPAPPAPMRRPK